MKLLTYRINDKPPNYKYEALDYKSRCILFYNLYQDILKRDNYWHFWMDYEGATLRISLSFEKKVTSWLKNRHINFKRRTIYQPVKHEYYGISFLGDDILPLFHEISVLSIKYPPKVIFNPILDRLNHCLMINCGVLGHKREAEMYLDMAFKRASVVNHTFRLPKFVYKLGLKITKFFK